MGRSATLCRSARPHTPRGDRRCTRSWLVSAVELRLGKISASLTQDLVGLTELAVLSLQGLELGGHVRGQARLAPAVSLGPANPLMQRLRRAADLRGNRSHRRPPRGMILLVLENQPNRKRAHFRRKSVRCLACHRSTFSRLGASGKPGAGQPSREASLQAIHPDDRERVRQEARQAVYDKRDYKLEFRTLSPAGTIKHIESTAHPKFSASGELVEVVSTIIDVTERKQAEGAAMLSAEALRRSEAYLAEAERLSHTGSWALNLKDERTIVYWSEESYRIYGLDPLQGLPARDRIWEQVHLDDRSKLHEEIQEAERQKKSLLRGRVQNLVARWHTQVPGGNPSYHFLPGRRASRGYGYTCRCDGAQARTGGAREAAPVGVRSRPHEPLEHDGRIGRFARSRNHPANRRRTQQRSRRSQFSG